MGCWLQSSLQLFGHNGIRLGGKLEQETILGDGKGNGLWLRLECVGELALITQYKVFFFENDAEFEIFCSDQRRVLCEGK